MNWHPYITTFEVMNKAGWGRPAPCAECGQHERHMIHRYHDLRELYMADEMNDGKRRYVPTLDAIVAAGEACQKFFKYHDEHPIPMNDAEFQVHIFNAGFHRGIEWFQRQSAKEIGEFFNMPKSTEPDPEPFI